MRDKLWFGKIYFFVISATTVVMDGLMSEATGLVLSSGRDITAGSYKMLKWESRRNSVDASSVTLLRLSITNSLKDIASEVVDTKPPNQNKCNRRRESSPRKPKVDVQFLNSEEDSLRVEVSPFSDKESNSNRALKEQSDPDGAESATFPESFKNHVQRSESEQKWGFESQEIEAREDKDDVDSGITADDKEQVTRDKKKIAENGLKLARRKFSDGIFENCSTYSLTCPEVLQERDNPSSSKHDQSADSKFSVDKSAKSFEVKPPKVSSGEDPCIIDYKKSASVDSDDHQISLSDSFFGNVTSEDYVSQKSIFSKESEHSGGSKKSSRASLYRENDLPVSEDAHHDNGGRFHSQKNERRLSKRLRKRRRKSKSMKDVPTYECPKCGASYILSANASDSTACCLHCDFWTSVEPVFLKREKQPWNTCRIC